MNFIRRMLVCVFLFTPFFLLIAQKEAPPNKRYYLSICAMFKNEAKWLKEWIEFHRLVGVEHFYLYNNLSSASDNYQEILAPYIDQKIVTLIEWPFLITNPEEFKNFQARAMEHGLSHADSTWVAMIDIDEYLFPCERKNLKKFLRPYETAGNVGAIFVNWYLYGTSYVNEIPQDKLLIESLVLRAENVDCIGKLIVQPKAIQCLWDVHYPVMVDGFNSIYADRTPATYWVASEESTKKIRLNHYWSRDRKYFDEVKSKRGNISWHANVEVFLNGFITDLFNHTEDLKILRFAPPLRQKMEMK